MRKFLSILVILVTFSGFQARADEGMWLLPLIEKLNIGTMTSMGLKLTAEDIYSLNKASMKDAIVIFGGGCTGEIVSPEGLLLTNHHCGYGSIQKHSSVEHDYLTNGFWAMNRKEELPNPGLSVTFLVRIEDVTSRVIDKTNNGMTEAERRESVDAESSAITAEAIKDTQYRAMVQPFYGGNQYFLLVYEVYTDVRLVGTPPNSIGKYGHDTDNWMWPRHTGDFSVFRVYMGPDGKPAQYSEDNVPLKPKYYLPVSIRNLQKNDFAMILGYPGGTERYMNALSLIENAVKGRAEKYNVQQYLSEVFRGSCEMISFAGQLVPLEDALTAKDSKKVTEIKERVLKNIDNFYSNYSYPTDRKVTKALLKLYKADIDPKFWPDFYVQIDKKFKGNVDAYVDDMFLRSFFTSPEKLKAFLDNPSLKLLQKDPAFIAAKSVSATRSKLQKDLESYSADLSKGQRTYIAGVMEYTPEKTKFPDANFTMRMTYGKVLDYYPYDAVHYNWYTTLDGVIQKYKKGDYEFDLPQHFIDLYNKKEYGRYAASEGYMPLCFITDNDITGGNSGSPVINGNGELIGLAFDGNWEAMTGDIAFEPELQRTICVDIRYVLWVMDIYAGAGHLLKEMDIR